MNMEEMLKCEVCGRSTFMDCADLIRVGDSFRCRAHCPEKELRENDEFWRKFQQLNAKWKGHTK